MFLICPSLSVCRATQSGGPALQTASVSLTVLLTAVCLWWRRLTSPAAGHLSCTDLHLPQSALQGQVLPLAAGDLHPQLGEPFVHQLTDLSHRRVSQHLHDGGQLSVEVHGSCHPVLSPLTARTRFSREDCSWGVCWKCSQDTWEETTADILRDHGASQREACLCLLPSLPTTVMNGIDTNIKIRQKKFAQKKNVLNYLWISLRFKSMNPGPETRFRLLQHFFLEIHSDFKWNQFFYEDSRIT